MTEQEKQSILDKLQVSVRKISNGFIMRNKDGSWYYKTEGETIKALGQYLIVLSREYDSVMKPE